MSKDCYIIKLDKEDAKDIVRELLSDTYEEYNNHVGIELEWFEGYQSGFKDMLNLLNIKLDDLQEFIKEEGEQ